MLPNDTDHIPKLPAIMPEKITNSKMTSSSKCSCCPYGFHIDRDFVRFCDTLYNSAQLDKLRQQRRERRKENKSVESYLGIGSLTSPVEIKKNCEVLVKNATLPRDFNLSSDGLKDAVSDFEDTWRRSVKKSSSSNDIPKNKNGHIPVHMKTSFSSSVHAFMEDRKDTLYNSGVSKSCSSSTSSVSSQSTTVSNFNGLIQYDVVSSELKLQDINAAVNFFKPTMAVGTTVQKSSLTNIRHQIATSLQRLKELEEQVKCIPVLKEKLSALKEEKKSLINQLKLNNRTFQGEKQPETQVHLENQLRKLENQGIMSPTLSRKCLSTLPNDNSLSSPGMASCLDAAISIKSVNEKEIIAKLNIVDKKSNLSEHSKLFKSIGTSCSVLTRDIGIGYVPNKLKSVAVGCDTAMDNKCSSKRIKGYAQYVTLSSESLESDSESFAGSDEHIQTHFPLKSTSLKCSKSKKNNSKSFTTSSTSMDIGYFDKSVNTDLIYGAIKSIVPPITSSKFVQTSESKSFRNTSSQTVSESKLTKFNKFNCDKAVGNIDVNETICSRCKILKRSVAVGDFDINISSCDKCQTEHVSSNYCVPSHPETKTIAVGDFDINVICDACEHSKSKNVLKNVEMQTVSINTGNDSAFSPNVSNSDINICDKCSATIHSVAKGLAANTSPLNSANSTESKIPRSNLRTSPGKINSAKLPKLKIPDYQNQKNNQRSDKDNPISKTSKDNKNVDSSTSISSENQKMISKNECIISYETDSSQEGKKSLEILPLSELHVIPRKKYEISKEIKAACKVLNDCLQKSDKGSEKKALSSLSIIQAEWFRIANQKNADPLFIEDYLDMFEDFSRHLLQRVVNLSDNNGNTALHYAVSYGNFDVVSILIDSKVCDVNKKNKAGYTSIMLVALADMKNDTHHYVVQRLFSIGDINAKATQNGQTALMLAVSHGKKDIAKILIDAGAEVNLQDKDGSTALMCAAEHGHLDIVKVLLSHPECDPTIVDNDDCNALTIAMEADHKDIGLLIYTSMNFSRGSSPYSTLKTRKRSTPRSTPPPRTPTLRTPPLPSPSARSTNSIPSSFHFST